MIVAVEGPRGAGKTTLVNALEATFRGAGHDPLVVRYPKRDWSPVNFAAESLLVETFGMLHRRESLYLFDRSWPVTSVVYARLRGEPDPPPDVASPPWLDDVTLVCLPGLDVGSLWEQAAYDARSGQLDGEVARLIYAEREDAGVLASDLLDVMRFRESDARLSDLVEVQRAFQEDLRRARHGDALATLSPEARTAALKDTVLAATHELHEFLDCLNWKMHARVDRAVDRSAALEEFVDALKFVLNLAVYAGFDVADVAREFRRKSTVVAARLREEFPESFEPARPGLVEERR